MLHTYFFLCIHKCTQLFIIILFECFFQILRMFFMLSWSFTDSQKLEARFKLILERFIWHIGSYSRKIKVKQNIKKFVWNGKLLNWIQKKTVVLPQYFSEYTTLVHIFFYMCTQLTHNLHICHFRVSKYITHVTHM